MIQLSLFTHDYETGKRFNIDEEDASGTSLISTTNGTIKTALVQKLKLENIEDLANVIEQATGSQHLTMGICSHDTVGCSYNGNVEGSVARNESDFKPPNSGNASIMCIDSDSVDENIRDQLLGSIPALGEYACVQTTSSSSNIFHENGYMYRGVGGLHTFFAVKDGKDIKRALGVFHKRLILSGYGNHKISGVGGFLERSAVDKMLSGASQPIYMKANLGDGLVQRKKTTIFNGLPVIDTRKIFKNLDKSENEMYEYLVNDARASMQGEMLRVRQEWESRQPSTDIAVRAIESNVLVGDFIIDVRGEGNVSVGNILRNVDKYHGMTCRDPMEPEYGSNTVAKIFCNQDTPMIFSNAHGGGNYRLIDASMIGFGQNRIPTESVVNELTPLAAAITTTTDINVPTAAYDIHTDIPTLEWHALHIKGNGNPLATLFNFKRMMDLYGIYVGYDLIKKETLLLGQNMTTEGDIKDNANYAIIYQLCVLNKMDVGAIDHHINQLMINHQVNPVSNWVGSKSWDGEDRLAQLFNTLNVKQERDIAWMMFTKWLMGSLRLAKGEITKFEHVLVLQASEGGEGKTRWFNKLCPNHLQLDGMSLDVDNKDHVKDCISHWLVELGELDSTFKKSDLKKLMSFLSMGKDNIRLAYAKCANSYQRRTSFFGTVNNENFLNDDSGDRRFWPIKVGQVEHAHTIDMQQVWAQVDTLTEKEWLDSEDLKRVINANKTFKSIDPIAEMMDTYFSRDIINNEEVRVNNTQLLQKIGIKNPNRSQILKCANWLKQNGYKKYDTHYKGIRFKGYIIPKFNEMIL